MPVQIALKPFFHAPEALDHAKSLYLGSVATIRENTRHIIDAVCAESDQGKTDRNILNDLKEAGLLEKLLNINMTCTYPIIVVRPYYYLNIEENNYHYDEKSDYFYSSTVTRLDTVSIAARLEQELETAQRGLRTGFFPYRKDRQPDGRPKLPIYVGKSNQVIPAAFALSDSQTRQHLTAATAYLKNEGFAKRKIELVTKIIQDVFPTPNLVNINDNIVDAKHKRRGADRSTYRALPSIFSSRQGHSPRSSEAAPFSVDDDRKHLRFATDAERDAFDEAVAKDKELIARYASRKYRLDRPLTFYDALRTDFSCLRLEHYTHTQAACFQDFALLTNYKTYVKSFLEILITSKVCKGEGVMHIPSFELDESLKSVLSPRLEARLKSGGGVALRLDKDWANEHIIFDDPAAADEDDPVAAADGAAQSGQKINSLPLKQWVDIWANNLSAQMPAYHYEPRMSVAQAERQHVIATLDYDEPESKADPDDPLAGYLPGISLVNIGVGPSNAKNLTDHLAVLRPLAWLMIGHCGGLRTTQQLGDFVLAHAYVRDDGVLDEELPPYVQIPEIQEVTEAIQAAASDILYPRYQREFPAMYKGRWFRKLLTPEPLDPDTLAPPEHKELPQREWERFILRSRLRVGTVATTDDRNWELNSIDDVIERFEKSRAIAIDMESATIAANGFRHRIFYGTLLCVSDRPLFGAIKMRGMATAFYEEATSTHMQISIRAVKRLLEKRYRLAASRKISGFDDPLLG